jgi:Zn finger protein HypA/HybF involved in hydrogenase expression
MLKPYSKELKTETVIKVKYIPIPDTETDAKCPNCDSLINSKKIKCWKCQASFDTNSSWRPIKI